MKELIRSNDLVFISWVRFVLNDFYIQTYILDEQMSVLEGSANAIPRRIMVDDDDFDNAVRALRGAQSEIDDLVLFDNE